MSGFEIRPIRAAEVAPVLDMLSAWEPPGYFARYFDGDPAFVPEHVCAAFDGARPISCAQIVPKTIRVVGGTARVAGIGQVWTEPGYRRRGIAPDVLRCCIDMMRRERFALSLLFASRLDFYASLGWLPYTRSRTAVVGWPDVTPDASGRALDPARDMPAVRALYDVYTRDIPGTTVRGESEWQGSLRTAAFPSETFFVAVDTHDVPVAYMRGAVDQGTYVVLEYAYGPGALDTCVALLRDHCLRARDAGGFLVMHLAHDAALAAHLATCGFALNTIDDPFIMWRVIDPTALPGTHPSLLSHEAERQLLETLLPRDRYTYWPSDSF